MIEKIQMPSSDSERRRELLSRNFKIWIESYSKGNFESASHDYSALYETAKELNADPETLASIIIGKSWSEYYVDKNGKTKTNASYLSAQEGLAKLQDLQNTPVVHAMRSSLLEVAGLCQAYLVDEKDSKAEPLFRHSIEEAEKSGFKTTIGEAKNGFALWLISPQKKHFKEAIPLFEEVAEIQKGENNRRGEGHAHNNLILCYNEIGQFEKAVEEADKALELYEDPNLNHSFSARFRKSIALRGLGKERRDKNYFDQAIKIYKLHIELRFQDKNITEGRRQELTRNELDNINNTQTEMEESGSV